MTLETDTSDNGSNQTKQCPYCAEPILRAAKKCKHCHESLTKRPKLSKLITQFMASVGMLTAVLSLFYALREGYFYIEKRQQQRDEIRSYLDVAAQFQQMDSMEYAQRALSKAIALSPSDISLQRRYFLLRAKSVLREVEWRLASSEESQLISELILDGFRLLKALPSNRLKADLLVVVARLLPHTTVWNDQQKINSFYQQAIDINKDNPEALFRYGQWMAGNEVDQMAGLGLMLEAIALSPQNALYHYESGRQLLDNGRREEAFTHFLTARDLLSEQGEIQLIRAANSAKVALRRLVIETSKKQTITEDGFLGKSMNEMAVLMDELLTDRPNDRELNLLVARLAFHQGLLEKALKHLKATLSTRDLASPVREYNQHIFRLYQDILQQLPEQQSELNRVKDALQQFAIAQGFEESMEFGIEGRNRYKVGLRIRLREAGEGLLVAKAFSGYPFYKAGVREGDTVLTFAHRQVDSLRQLHLILDKFELGTSIPVTCLRDGKIESLDFIVE